MTAAGQPTVNRRILIIDDTPAIHEDLAKVLRPLPDIERPALSPKAAALLEAYAIPMFVEPDPGFELSSAYQGEEGLEIARAAAASGRPFALAIVDGRMPPGWDGVETIKNLWEICPDLQVIICTAYADYTWEEISRILGTHDNLVILKKPFEVIEVRQMAESLVQRWARDQQARLKMDELHRLIDSRASDDPPAPRPFDRNSLMPTGSAPPGTDASSPIHFILNGADQISRDLQVHLENSRIDIISRLAVTLRPHRSQLGAFGEKLPAFLTQLASQLDRERDAALNLVEHLVHLLEHMREAVPSQTHPASPLPASPPKPLDPPAPS